MASKIKMITNSFLLPAFIAFTMFGIWTPLAANSQTLVANGSFETVAPAIASTAYTTSFGSLSTNAVSNWAFGISSGSAYDGIVTSGGFGLQVIEDGNNAAFVQGTGLISQNVALPSGSYSLSFYAIGRTSANGGNGANPITVSVGNLLNQTFTPGNAEEDTIADWTLYNYTFTVTAGTYSLRFSGNDPFVGDTDDHMTMIDNVSIVPISSIPPPTITSEPSPQQVLYVGQNAQFTVESSGSSPIHYQWQIETNGAFVNLINSGRYSGVATATLTISNLNIEDSTNYIVSVANIGGATNSTVAALTVLAAPPPGSPRGAVTVINPSFEDCLVTNDTYTTGYGTLNPQSGVPGWQFSSSGGDSFAGIVTESGGILGTPKYIPQCWQAAFIQGTGQFSQAVTFKSAGTNVIRFRAEGRSSGGAGGETIQVSVDGNAVGTFTPLTTQWSLYTSIAFSATAGTHVIAFKGTVPFSTSDRVSFIDAVQIITPAEAAVTVPPTSPVYDIVFVGDSITYGATLSDPSTQASSVRCMESLGRRFNVGVRMSNQGHSGATTVDWLPSSSYFQGAVAAAAALESNQPGQLIFSIMLGVNDSAQSGPNGSPVSPSNFQANLQSSINQFLGDYPDAYVFVHYPTWYSTNTQNGALYGAPGLARLQTYFPEIDQLISDYAITHPGRVFTGDKLAFNDFSNNYLTEQTPESGVQGTFYLHPNAAGSVVLGKFWADAIAVRLNFITNDSYVAWLQSNDMIPGTPGTRFSDTPTNSVLSNGVAYGNPDGLNVKLVSQLTNLDVCADIRSDTKLTFALEDSNNLIDTNWNPLAWPIVPSQSGVATGFIRHAVQVPINYLQQENFYRLTLHYVNNY
jgi:lysophospholipase L1-like esterase